MGVAGRDDPDHTGGHALGRVADQHRQGGPRAQLLLGVPVTRVAITHQAKVDAVATTDDQGDRQRPEQIPGDDGRDHTGGTDLGRHHRQPGTPDESTSDRRPDLQAPAHRARGRSSRDYR